MAIQSLSLVVPNKKCFNSCKFCVSCMRTEEYENKMDDKQPFYNLYEKDFIKRLEFARDNGCNTIMLTGNSEPQQNRGFLQNFGSINNHLEKPFRCIEMQTTGIMLDRDYLRFLRNHVGVSTISLSLSSFFDDQNRKYIQANRELYRNIMPLCEIIKEYDFNLRLSLNLTDAFNKFSVGEIFESCKILGADQITFRVLYSSGLDTPQDKWISEHSINKTKIGEIRDYIYEFGTALEKLPFGATKYSVNEMSVVLDDDCMSKEVKGDYKYLILRPNCKLYSKWDDKGSLIF